MKTRCRKCNKMFNNNGVLGLNKCPACSNPYRSDPDKVKLVRDLVKDNPNISALEVSEITGLSRGEIVEYIKGEVLEFSHTSQAYLRCEECGVEIRTGRLCSGCKVRKQNIQAENEIRNKKLNQLKHSRKFK